MTDTMCEPRSHGDIAKAILASMAVAGHELHTYSAIKSMIDAICQEMEHGYRLERKSIQLLTARIAQLEQELTAIRAERSPVLQRRYDARDGQITCDSGWDY